MTINFRLQSALQCGHTLPDFFQIHKEQTNANVIQVIRNSLFLKQSVPRDLHGGLAWYLDAACMVTCTMQVSQLLLTYFCFGLLGLSGIV